jgi:FG-GAP repeat
MTCLKSIHVAFLTLALASPAHAQFTQQGGKFAGGGAAVAFAGQGSSVAVSGDDNTAAIAANSESAVWIFTRTNAGWNQQGAKLSVSGCSGPASPGCSVSLSDDGNTLLVGAPFDDIGVGSARVFVRDNNGAWTQRGKLAGNDSVGAAQQGYSVALASDGNTAVVGGPLDASGSGATWVFTRNANGVWTQHGTKLVGTGAAGPAWQGNGVAISAGASTLLTGGPFDSDFAGATWVFGKDANGDWIQEGPKLVGTGAVGPAFQGQSVSISAGGNTALIGAPQDNINNRVSVGAAWVFKRTGPGTWTQQGPKLVANDFIGFPRQGQSVSISGSGNTAVVGGPFDDGGKGAVWVYTRNNAGVWTQQGAKLVGTGADGVVAEQGQSVAISLSGTRIVSGGPGDNHDLGAAWVFGLARFRVIAPTTANPGAPLSFTVSVLDADDGPFAGYSGTVHFTSSDNNATLPVDSALISIGGNIPVDVPTFSAILRTNGNQTISVTDTAVASLTGTSNTIMVGPFVPVATHFSITAPASANAGTAFNFTVTALDSANQVVPGYTGPVRFSSTDTAANLPANTGLTNGAGTFAATLRSAGPQTISVFDAANSAIIGASNLVTVSAVTAPPVPLGVGPASGNTADAALNFSFQDPRGVQDLGVLNILINNALDGRHACYLAYSRPLNVLYLLDDNGDLNPISVASLNGPASLSNSQCTVSWGVSAIAAISDTVNLALNFTFSPSFGGNKAIYLAARDVAENNSGWRPLGVWQVPGAHPSGTTSVLGMTLRRGSGLGPVPITFGFSDTRGFEDLGVMNILVNDSIDGRLACYLAYARSSNTLYLVSDNGESLLPGQSMAAPGSVGNSQCTVTWNAEAVFAAGNGLTISLNLGFRAAFAGNRIFYLAARDAAESNNTDWQPAGTWTVQ